MCGVIAVLRRRSTRAVPSSADTLRRLDQAVSLAKNGLLRDAATVLTQVDSVLRGVPGTTLLMDASVADAVRRRVAAVDAVLVDVEASLEQGVVSTGELEDVNATLVACKDATWAIGHDRLGTAAAIAAMSHGVGIDGYLAIQIALASLDRLEVRGRDSAGLHVLVTGSGIAADDPDVVGRSRDPLFASGSVRAVGDGVLGFVYKAAAEIGELGDNGAVLRRAITEDELLRRALSAPDAEATVLGHTRWASVGIISQANAHPVNSEEVSGPSRPYVIASLNGDVDNYVRLREEAGLRIPSEMTTDAKVIPTLVARRLADGADPDDAFRETVATFEGSVAIGACLAATPDRIHLALKGSGQALYVGLAEDAFIAASEPYGLVEETPHYVRIEGGQVVVIDRAGAGSVGGVRRMTEDGTLLPVTDADVVRAEITTRDIDRAGFPHFLLKEISEAPTSFRKTLRGRVVTRDGRLCVDLGPEAMTLAVRARLESLGRIVVIGQGTAAVAARSIAASLDSCLPTVPVSAMLATELSGFALTDDMSDTLVVAVSQSGTTTDTNRTVDLVRARGATVLAVVNRRHSDLVDKSDGVLYNSDGRDVEMAVPSTKAFYAQVAAGFLLALGISAALGCGDPEHTHALLGALRALPDAMTEMLQRRPALAEAARLAPSRRYWAVVGNGRNRVAADEVRIKLSELCYKSIACDSTEDKKHIDLSSEPLILVCAAGLDGPNAADVAKEIAIYRAHKAVPIVVATDGADELAAGAAARVFVPRTHPDVAFVLSAMAGHLFGYEAALSIDAQARPLREGRAAIEAAVASADAVGSVLDRLGPPLAVATRPFVVGLADGEYNGHMEASTAVKLATLLRYATGQLPLESYELESGRVGTPTALVDDVVAALTKGIDELTRPIDAIKHQAKTVTVGISRSEDELLGSSLVAALLATGARRDQLLYRTLRTLAALDPAVAEVTGHTRYAIDDGTIHVVDQGGSAAGLRSRTAADRTLRGTKRRVVETREVIVTVGRSDGRELIMVPEVKANQVTGVSLLHVRFVPLLSAADARKVLEGYGPNRYSAFVDAVTETTPQFDDAVLSTIPVVDLLTQPVNFLADRWRS